MSLTQIIRSCNGRFLIEVDRHSRTGLPPLVGMSPSFRPKPIWWQGNEYAAWPYQLEGLENQPVGAMQRHH
jgi:phage-related protein